MDLKMYLEVREIPTPADLGDHLDQALTAVLNVLEPLPFLRRVEVLTQAKNMLDSEVFALVESAGTIFEELKTINDRLKDYSIAPLTR